jgi:hypothetical protein
MHVTRLLLFACMSLIAASLAAAELGAPVGSLAVIEDPDDFVNMRSKADTNSEVVLKIQRDEFFVCEPEESDWWRVKDFFGNEGYMHKSRIRLVKDLPGKALERLFVNPPVAPADELVGQNELAELYHGKTSIEFNGIGIGGDASLFVNSDLDQCIYLEYHTDNFVPEAVLFRKSDIPKEVFDELERTQTKDGELASLEAKKAAWQGLLVSATEIPSRHFQSVRGLRLGDRIEKAIKMFGKSHNRRQRGEMTIYEWGFPGGLYYGWDYSESKLGVLDAGRVTEDRKLMKLSLDADQLNKIEEHMQNSKFEESLREYVLLRTRGSRVHLGLGYRVRLYVRDGKIIALAYEWGFE